MYVVACSVGGCAKELCIVSEAIHYLCEGIIVADFKSSLTCFEFLCFLEFVVVRSEDDRYVPYCSLRQVVYASSESTAYICHRTIFIYGREESEAVDDEYFGIGKVAVAVYLCVAHYSSALQHLHNVFDMTFGYDVGCDDEFPVTMLIEIFKEYFLIGQP